MEPIPLSALQHAVYCLRQAALIHLERLWAEEVAEGELDPGTRLLREVSPRDRGRAVVVERICALIIGELRRQGLSGSTSTFLVEHGEAVQATITDPDLARIPTQYE